LGGADGIPSHWNGSSKGGGGGGEGNAGGGSTAGVKKDDNGRRNYNKPWLAPEKEKKEAKTYAEHVYPDGVGPDTDLINMIEKDVLI
jgi:hypothetical protein